MEKNNKKTKNRSSKIWLGPDKALRTAPSVYDSHGKLNVYSKCNVSLITCCHTANVNLQFFNKALKPPPPQQGRSWGGSLARSSFSVPLWPWRGGQREPIPPGGSASSRAPPLPGSTARPYAGAPLRSPEQPLRCGAAFPRPQFPPRAPKGFGRAPALTLRTASAAHRQQRCAASRSPSQRSAVAAPDASPRPPAAILPRRRHGHARPPSGPSLSNRPYHCCRQ